MKRVLPHLLSPISQRSGATNIGGAATEPSVEEVTMI